MNKRISDETIKEVLDFDPIDNLQKVTGRDYREESMKHLVLSTGLQHNALRKSVLESQDDVAFGCSLDHYLEIIVDEGFQKIYGESFEGSCSGETEYFYVYWHSQKAILLCFDTFGSNINSGNFYYCLKPKSEEDWEKGYQFVSSGGMARTTENKYWLGSHDCREALRFHIRSLGKHYHFCNPWVESPHLWLHHHMDAKGIEDLQEAFTIRKELEKTRMAKFPAEVQKAIGYISSTGETFS